MLKITIKKNFENLAESFEEKLYMNYRKPARFVKDMAIAANREIRAKRFRPMYALCFLTFRCTSRCKCCNIWKFDHGEKRNEMDLEEWKIVIDELFKSGVRDIEVFGGDSLLRKDMIFDFIHYCHSKGMRSYFPTNSNLIDEKTARQLGESKLSIIYFSLDGTKEIHDKIRGQKGSYNRIVKAIERVSTYRGNRTSPEIVINTTISKMNYRYMDNFLDDMKKIPIDSVLLGYLSEFSPDAVLKSAVQGIKPEPHFMSTEETSNLLSSSEVNDFRQMLRKWQTSNNYPYYLDLENVLLISDEGFELGEFPKIPCLRMCLEPVITPYGDVLPCASFTKYPLGNLLENSMDEIWGNQYHKNFATAQREKEIDICKHCNTVCWKRGLNLTLKSYISQ